MLSVEGWNAKDHENLRIGIEISLFTVVNFPGALKGMKYPSAESQHESIE